jgi:hypothetical protein
MSFPKAVYMLALASVGLAAWFAQAQKAPPTAYTIIEAVPGGAPGSALTINRSGSKALTIMDQPAQGDNTPASRTLTLYDLQSGTTLSWEPSAHPPECSRGTFTGDWGDPFGMTAEIASGVAKGELKLSGTEMAGGVSSEVYTGGNGQATTKAWLDKADGLVMRAVISAPGSPPMTLVDIRKVSFAAPPPSLFAPPPGCAGVRSAPSAADTIAGETGDNAANYVNGMYGPGSQNSCSVVLRVVSAKTMTPLSHIQVAIDTSYKQENPPHYDFGVHDDGSQSYSGGGVHEITPMVHNGTVRLGNLPPYFMLGVNTIHPGHGGGMGLVYRQCFAPTTVLLYVVRDFGQPSEAGDFLWVKAGKYAAAGRD